MTAQADLRVEAAHLRRFLHNFRSLSASITAPRPVVKTFATAAHSLPDATSNGLPDAGLSVPSTAPCAPEQMRASSRSASRVASIIHRQCTPLVQLPLLWPRRCYKASESQGAGVNSVLLPLSAGSVGVGSGAGGDLPAGRQRGEVHPQSRTLQHPGAAPAPHLQLVQCWYSATWPLVLVNRASAPSRTEHLSGCRRDECRFAIRISIPNMHLGCCPLLTYQRRPRGMLSCAGQVVGLGVDAYLKMLLVDNYVHTGAHEGHAS